MWLFAAERPAQGCPVNSGPFFRPSLEPAGGERAARDTKPKLETRSAPSPAAAPSPSATSFLLPEGKGRHRGECL